MQVRESILNFSRRVTAGSPRPKADAAVHPRLDPTRASRAAGVDPREYAVHGDGSLMGPDGRFSSARLNGRGAQAFLPVSGLLVKQPVVFVNGMTSTKACAMDAAQEFADWSGHPVFLLFNASRGFWRDLWESTTDLLSLTALPGARQNRPTRELAELIVESVRAGETLHLFGHSQGAVIISRALCLARDRLAREDGQWPNEKASRLATLKVETFGSEALYWPKGPTYVHHRDHSDWLTWLSARFPCTMGGARAVADEFLTWGFLPAPNWAPYSHDIENLFEHGTDFHAATGKVGRPTMEGGQPSPSAGDAAAAGAGSSRASSANAATPT